MLSGSSGAAAEEHPNEGHAAGMHTQRDVDNKGLTPRVNAADAMEEPKTEQKVL